MSFDIRKLQNKLLSFLTEGTRAPHPEDEIFTNGASGAKEALNYFSDLVSNPGEPTIKWDGYPALVFGRDANGRFSITDKHMFDKKDGSGRQIYSPQDFFKYDANRGVDRSGLNTVISNIWEPLEQQTRGTEGYYWGDLLFGQPMTPKSGKFIFQANPKGLTYKVDAKSDIGKLLQNKTAGIAVHTYIPPNAVSTSQAKSLNGSLGALTNNGSIALLPAKITTIPKLQPLDKEIKKVDNEVNNSQGAIDEFFKNSPVAQSTLSNFFTTYINKRVGQGDLKNLYKGFLEHLGSTPMTTSMREKLTTYFNSNANTLKLMFKIWSDLYNLKVKLKHEFDNAEKSSPVQAFNSENERVGHEGYIFRGKKLVDRLAFTQHLFKNRQ